MKSENLMLLLLSRNKVKYLVFVTLFVFSSLFESAYCSAGDISHDQIRQVLNNKAVPPHPRLFIIDDNLAEIKNRINASDSLKILHDEIIRQTDILLDEKPLERKKIGRRLLRVSIEAVKRMFNLGWAYRATGDEKYLKRGERELLAIAEFKDWNPSHFLDVAEMTFAMAVGYDWLYNGLSDESKKTIRQAILIKGIDPSVQDKGWNWWVNSKINWNQVCHGGITAGALAIMEDEPELAEKIIHRSVNKVQLAMGEYEPDGAYPEGPSYWQYGTSYNVLLIEMLNSVLGTDFGLSQKVGFKRSAEYYLHAAGPTGAYFNYSDCGSGAGMVPTVSWFAKRYDNPSLLWNQKKIFDKIAKTNPSDLLLHREPVLLFLWAEKEVQKPSRLSWMGQGQTPVTMFRSSWDDNATYLAIKGGTASTSHAQMDAGSFVIDALGERWAMDLGKEDYHRIETFGIVLYPNNQKADRWKLFRYNNFGHNTLTINNQLHNAKGFVPIVRYSDKSNFPHVAIDMTDLYKEQIKKALRGATLLPSGQILIQDQIQANDTAATIRWNMVTPAKIEIKSDTTARLLQNGKAMQFKVVTGSKAKLATYSTAPRSKPDGDNGNTRMIGFDIKLKPNESTKIQVVMTPGEKEKKLNQEFNDIIKWSQPLTEVKN